MAKGFKNSSFASKSPAQNGSAGGRTAAPAPAPVVRNSPVPKVSTAAQGFKRSAVTHDQIAQRAYEIWQSGQGGSQDENWYRALRELNGGK
jgi:hypothetical protein